jgi:hypothetical protein
LAKAVDALAALAPRVQDPTTQALLRKVSTDWTAVRERVLAPGVTAADSMTAHSALVASLLGLTDLLTDDFGLSLDPDLDSYQLIQSSMVSMPVLSEELARVRGLGVGLLVSNSRKEADIRPLVMSLARADDALQAMQRTYGKAAAANADLKKQLDGPVAEAVAQARRAAALARDKVLEPAQAGYAPTEFYAQMSLAVQAQLGVRGNADSVVTASTQIAQGNQDLSQRTEEQANALQQTAARWKSWAVPCAHNADNAQQANELAQDATRHRRPGRRGGGPGGAAPWAASTTAPKELPTSSA